MTKPIKALHGKAYLDYLKTASDEAGKWPRWVSGEGQAIEKGATMTKRETCKWETDPRQSAVGDSYYSTCGYPLPAWMTRNQPYATVRDRDCDRCPCHEPKTEEDDDKR